MSLTWWLPKLAVLPAHPPHTVTIQGTVFNITLFLREHPGGAGILLGAAGMDATAAFNRFHP